MSQRVTPKIETIVIAVFCFAFVVWAWSKCSDKKAEMARRYANEEERDEPHPRKDTVAKPVQVQPVQPQQAQPAAPQTVGGYAVAPPATYSNPQNPQAAAPQNGAAKPAAPAAQAQTRTVLYATMDGIKVRKEPGMKGAVVDKLKLFEDVTFLNQKTEWEEEFSLAAGQAAVKDHWVKIRTKRGKEGWVFGAGVHYYKLKR